ncbi:MAG: hypothetical protein WA941_15435 [Nitrososphaeraceae archaeon]
MAIITIVGTILALLMISTALFTNANATGEIIYDRDKIYYDKDADLPICVYKEIKDCKVRNGLICVVETTLDPCQDIFHGFTGTDENYKPETDQFIVPDDDDGDDDNNCDDVTASDSAGSQ